jgi:putative endonuclease
MNDGAYLYILRCVDGSYYTGTARSGLEQRVAEHNAGRYGGYTAQRRPVTLVFSQWFDRITDAIAAERQVKGWSRAKRKRSFAVISARFVDWRSDGSRIRQQAHDKHHDTRAAPRTMSPRPHAEEPHEVRRLEA